MKTIFKISIVLFLLCSVRGNAQTFKMLEAYTDSDCKNVTAEFKIPKSNIGYYFDLKIVPKWSDCTDNGNIDYNMVGIRMKNDNAFMYQCYIYRNGDIKESSDLKQFILGPGNYELVISSQKGNSVNMKYYTGTEIALIDER